MVPAGEVLERLAATQSQAPPGGPTQAQLNFERQLEALATPVPPPRRTRWLLWALITVLVGAGAAAAVEYLLRPSSLYAPSGAHSPR